MMTLRSELVVFAVWLVVTSVASIATAAIAQRKGRSPAAFFAVGVVLSVLGVLVAVLLPAQSRPARSRSGPGLPTRLAELNRRHASGELSDAELAAARAELLGG